MEPFVFMTRFYAFKHGMETTRTAERLDQLAEKGIFSETKRDELLRAYTVLLRMRLEGKSGTSGRTGKVRITASVRKN